MGNFDFTKDFFGYIKPSPDAPFYVYLLLRPNGQAFYVGKGIGKRIDDHEKEARQNHDCYKCAVIRKIWRSGGEVGKQIIFTTRNENEAYRVEAITIQRLRSQIVNHYERDPRMRGSLDDIQRRLTPKEQAAKWAAREDRIIRKIAQLECQLRYTNLTGDLEERTRLKDEIALLDMELDPPSQMKLGLE